MSKSEDIKTLFDKYVMPTYAPAQALVKGQGTRVWDAEGMVYLDFASGISVLNLGHSHPHVVEAIQKQAAELIHVSNLYYTENQARLAQKLSSLGLGGKVFFANSGAEANEGMIKLARLWGHEKGKYEIICMTNSFHGRTLAAAAATGQEKVQAGFEPMPEGFYHIDYNDLDGVRALITDESVAVLLEPVQGEAGVVAADPEFMKGVRQLCDEHNLLMLCDEVQCGMGRVGNWFGYQEYGVEPDAISMAKALGSGYPIGAVVSGKKLQDVFSPGKHASTFGGSPLACAAALATIQVIEEERLIDRARIQGKRFKQQLEALVPKFDRLKEVRGCGYMLGLVVDDDAKSLCDLLALEGLLTIPTAGNVVRLYPPLNVKDAELAEALEMIEEGLAEWHGLGEED